MGNITVRYEKFRQFILSIGGSLQSGEEISEKGTICIIAETPHFVVYSLPLLVMPISFTFGQKYKIT
jgi:hypothetical protein